MTTSEKMPLILDDAMPVDLNNVDDLFGDGVGLSLPVRPQGKQLQQRLDELRSRGCCQTLAWSRTGTIASISPDGQSVELRHLRRHPDSGSWDLSDPTTCQLVKGSPSIPLVHLAWAGTSTPDLAVIDAVGRVTIFSFSISLNHPYGQRKWDADPIDDLHAVAGAYWLNLAPSNQQAYNVMHGPAYKHGNNYTYESSFVQHGGPAHPNPAKSALITISMNGTLRMFWSQNTNRMEETTMELESVNSSDELITHATFASERKHLLLALATSSKQIRLIKIEIHWGGPAQTEKGPAPHARSLSPTLVESHLATINLLQDGPNDSNRDAFMPELSQLQVLPSVVDASGKNMTPAMVVAIRSRGPNEGSYEMTQTTFDRWEAVDEKQDMHPAFGQLGSRRNSVSSELPTVTHLKKVDPVVINKVIIDFQTISFGKVLVLAFANGSVEYRDRYTFEELFTTEDLNKVMNLRQVGWTFADEGHCQQVAFSPTYCSFIQIGDDGKVKWNKLHYPGNDLGDSMQDARYAASIAGLTVTAASSVFYQNNYDDILAIARPYTTKKKFVQEWITELIRILKIQVDYSEETHHDSLVRNGSLQSCLSIVNALGFRGEFNPRSFQGKFSLLSLNVRNVVVLITIASNTPLTVREKLSPLDEPEVVETLAGCAKWSFDLITWLIDSLFELMNDEKFTELLAPQRFTEIAAYLHEKNNISLHFLLSSSSRGFLSAVCRRLGHLEAISIRAIDFYRKQSTVIDSSSNGPATQLQQAYQKMQQVTSSGLVKVTEFEKLLTVLGNDIRQSYQAYLPSLVKAQQSQLRDKQIDMAVKTRRIQFELAMLLSASPPPFFLQLMNKFFKKDLAAFRHLTDPSQLFFASYDLLEVQDDKRSLAAKRARGMFYVDVFKRLEIKPGPNQQWRRCSRCAAVMEDVFGSRPGFTFVLTQQRKCACGGHWTLLPRGKVFA